MSTDLLQFCSQIAREHDEPLLGTAVRNDLHFVMAVPKNEWLARIEDMQGRAGDFARLIKPLKDQAVISFRNCAPEEAGTIWLFPHAYRFGNLPPGDYETLVRQALNGEITLPHEKITGQHFIFVCTHGKRDQCCARFGGAALAALREQAPDTVTVWEVSHLGGHRFAGTMVVQPESRWYGRITPGDVPELLRAIQTGTVLVGRYRGNASLPPPLQAAECWGWEQLLRQNQSGDVNLVNPHIDGNHASVMISLESGHGAPSQKATLTLKGVPLTFQAGCDGETKDRLVWEIESVQPV